MDEHSIRKVEALYFKYNKIMYDIAHRILCDHQLTQDAVQMAFAKIIENIDKTVDVDCNKTKAFLVIICIPENFSVDEISQGSSTIITFKDRTSNLLIFEQSEDMSKEYMIDTEDANKENILIQGQNAVIIIKGKIITVFWQNNERVFNVCGHIEREEILKFCESLYLKK